jgi:hypothetical protein
MERAGMRAVAPVQGGLFYQARTFIPKLAVARHLPMLAYALRAGVALSIVQQQQQFVSFDLAARLAAAAEVSEAFF